MQYKILLAGLLFFPFTGNRDAGFTLAKPVSSNTAGFNMTAKKERSPSFLTNAKPFWETEKAKPTNTDDALKQTNWYAEAMKGIAEKEYEINYDAVAENYTAPNRKNNLRSSFTASVFTLQPRNDSAEKWKLTLNVKGIYADNHKIYTAVKNAAATKKGNAVQFNNNNNFVTEYVNTTEGVRQNFMINKEPRQNTKQLSVKLAASKTWFVNKVSAKEIHFAKATKKGYDKKVTYNSLKVWDAANRELDAGFSVVKNEISITVNTANAIYPITIDPISTTAATLLESNQANSGFGWSVASAGDVNGDGYSDVIVGANLYDNGQTNEGAAFVYHGSATGISTTAAVLLETNQAGAEMGRSVSGAGDVNGDGYSDVIVGAISYDNGQVDEGAAFIYHGSATGISTTAAAQVESNQASANMGGSVACAGDVNGDGYSDVIVGANLYDNGQSNEGVSFIYHGSATGINITAAALVESNQANAFMGRSVASAGDVNGDGYSDVIVGAELYDNGQTDEGAAFVYHGSASGINTTAATQLETNQADARTGNSVASAGDVNGDGYSDVIVGAFLYDNGQTNEGAAFVYHGSAAGISTTAAAQVESNQASAFMGGTVASAGDVNGDGYSDVIVAASSYDNGETDEGAVFVYYGGTSGINTTVGAFIESNQVSASMGNSLASAGDVNGDGYSDIIVGSQLYDNGQTNEGAAFVYHGSASGISNTAAALVESNQAGANLGFSVASAGDVNGDGYSDIIVGALFYDNGQADEGAAFVYHGSATGLNITPAAQVESNQAFAEMGISVASAGDVNGDGYSDVIIGANLYDNGQTDEGAAFVYHGSAAGISTTIATQLESNQVGATMGYSVASAGDVNGDGYSDVIVGADKYDNGQTDEGAAFVYHGSAAGVSTTISTQLEINQSIANMGISVASAGDVNGDGYSDVIIGANFYDNGQTDEGAAFVYHGSATGISTGIATQLESNQAGATMGRSVASAGDVNGDGYSDVIVGAYLFDNGQTDEGAAFVFHGSATGISTSIATQLESNQANAQMGISVASAGDVNGDGYSDVIVGANKYDNGQTDEGVAFVYHGSASGISTTIATQLESNQANANMGVAVASAGDVNGDGYSDVIVGAWQYSNGQTTEGAAFVYMGNAGGGLRNNLRLYNTDLVTPIQRSNRNDPNLFGAGLYAKSPLGRVKGKLVWQVKKQGQAFSGNPITNSTAFLAKQPSFTNLGIAGAELKYNVAKQGFQNKIRVRVEYHKVTAITGQVYGPWRYPPGYTQGAFGFNATPLPVKLISFNGQFINKDDVQLQWITSNEINVQSFVVEKSIDGQNFTAAGLTPASGNGSNRQTYTLTDKDVKVNLLYYRLKIIEKNGDNSYSQIITLSRNKVVENFIGPNPVNRGNNTTLTIQSATDKQPIQISIINTSGQIIKVENAILQRGKNLISILTQKMTTGLYLVQVKGNAINETYRLVVQ